MSMNLNAKSDSGDIELWQTPTQISYTILPPSISTCVKGKGARKALLRYMEWVRFSTNGCWDNEQELYEAQTKVRNHLAYISSHLDDEGLTVWVM